MKTPMQELIEKLNNVKPTEFCSIETIKGWAEAMLEKEKEQIIDAWWDGVSNWDNESTAEQYYNETFNTKENV